MALTASRDTASSSREVAMAAARTAPGASGWLESRLSRSVAWRDPEALSLAIEVAAAAQSRFALARVPAKHVAELAGELVRTTAPSASGSAAQRALRARAGSRVDGHLQAMHELSHAVAVREQANREGAGLALH